MARNLYYSGPASDHFDGLRFFPPGGAHDKSLGDLFKMLRDARRLRAPWPAAGPTLPCPAPPARSKVQPFA